ncbi:glutathione transferase GstA [Caldimonas sp. KR1-144]|uniref:glutathione transferase GstA n=1 Tax=Caldimonas sp. KR1-144 TaxID=3400911 RepID=UPI003C0A3448
MKLYFSPGACSLSPHIVLHETGLPFTPVFASTKTKKLADGSDFYAINPKGQVPVLELDDGTRLTEGPAIVQYLADRVPEKKLAPPNGTMERYRLQEWLNFITSELHKSFSPLFVPTVPEEYKAMSRARLGERLAWVDRQLAGRDYLMGDTFTVADAYLFVVAGWGKHVGVDTAGLPNLSAFLLRVAERPSAKAALATEAQARK